MSEQDFDSILKSHQPHIDEVLERVRLVILKSIQPGSKLRPDQFIFDALYISHTYKGFAEMSPDMRIEVEQHLMSKLHNDKRAGLKCAAALQIAALYAVMDNCKQSSFVEEA